MKTYVWTSESNELALPIQAETEEQAMRIVLAIRLRSLDIDPEQATPAEVANQMVWFHNRDSLVELGSPLTEAPYTGPLPEDGLDDGEDSTSTDPWNVW